MQTEDIFFFLAVLLAAFALKAGYELGKELYY